MGYKHVLFTILALK